ncbi:MAG: ATP-grasp domain-containing protein [Methanosarcinaceae archaeon]|nr:ATP-grasp domain-containing protein [Methanosarcinaceae archaeon]
MIILDNPYVSDFLRDAAAGIQAPVLRNEMSSGLKPDKALNLFDEAEFIELAKEKGVCKLYTNSENSIDWISENLGFTGLPEKIELFKNKVRFRELLERIYPDFQYREVKFGELDKIRIEELKKPFIIKPAVGFFSFGVHKISENEEWARVLKIIKAEVEILKGIYPVQVLDVGRFLIEECIEGEEFAVDAYYNGKGKPVILNVLKHIFSSATDVSDRVYFTSKEVIETYRESIEDLLKEIGKLADLRDFPFHIELRIGMDRKIQPIELNPMRFAGWCTTDIAHFAYGINTYKYFLEGLEPDWNRLLEEKDGKNYCLIVLDKGGDLASKGVKGFDYEKLLEDFERPLELRKTDHEKYKVFGFLFTETPVEKWGEIERILKSDLKEYVIE